jgi:hypothetical protein
MVVQGVAAVATAWLARTTELPTFQEAGAEYLAAAAGVIVLFTMLIQEKCIITIYTETAGQDPNGERSSTVYVVLSCL